MLVLLTQIAYGTTQIQYSLDNATWTNQTNTNQNHTIIEELRDGMDENTVYYFRLRNIYDNGNSSWVYTSTKTIPSGEIPMSSLAVIGFVTLITLGVFILPSKVGRFSKYNHYDYLFKGLIYTFGLLLLSLIAAMIATISDTFNLGVTQEVFRFLWFLEWGSYLSMFFVTLVFGKRALESWKVFKENKSMGYNNEEVEEHKSSNNIY